MLTRATLISAPRPIRAWHDRGTALRGAPIGGVKEKVLAPTGIVRLVILPAETSPIYTKCRRTSASD